MTEQTVNTQTPALTVEQAVQRLQERRAATATPEPKADLEADKLKQNGKESEVIEPTDNLEDEEPLDKPEDAPDQEDPESGNGDEEVFVVTIKNEAGEEVEQEVTSTELVKGYMRNADYTRKRTQEKAEHQSRMKEADEKVSQLSEAIQSAIAASAVELQSFQNIDWNTLQNQDVNEYNRMQLAFRDAQSAVAYRQRQLQAIRRYQQEREQLELSERIREQSEILKESIPNWDTRKEELKSYLVNQGISDFRPFVDANMAMLVHKAKQFDDLQAKKELVVKKKVSREVPGTLPSGTPANASEVDRNNIASLEAQLQKTGSMEDAVRLRQLRRGVNNK